MPHNNQQFSNDQKHKNVPVDFCSASCC